MRTNATCIKACFFLVISTHIYIYIYTAMCFAWTMLSIRKIRLNKRGSPQQYEHFLNFLFNCLFKDVRSKAYPTWRGQSWTAKTFFVVRLIAATRPNRVRFKCHHGVIVSPDSCEWHRWNGHNGEFHPLFKWGPSRDVRTSVGAIRSVADRSLIPGL